VTFNLTIGLAQLLLIGGIFALAAPFIFHREESRGDYSFDVTGLLWVAACWPVGLVLLVFAALEFWRA
jgi:hypothetical protein